ncbi:MAG: GspH/FimT family pseudopilin [Methylococcales bacterium]|nr:GspH/FimT family pseudopilin [Methylococcales bacterium]
MKPAHGFTLLELTVVLVIMVLALGLVGLNINSGQSTTALKAAVRSLTAQLRHARTLAMLERRETTLTLDLEHNEYWLDDGSGAHALDAAIGLTLDTAQQEQYSASQAGFRFFPDGSASGGRITLNNDSGVWHIDISWLTGRIAARMPHA